MVHRVGGLSAIRREMNDRRQSSVTFLGEQEQKPKAVDSAESETATGTAATITYQRRLLLVESSAPGTLFTSRLGSLLAAGQYHLSARMPEVDHRKGDGPLTVDVLFA
jgi:hypothetical protein